MPRAVFEKKGLSEEAKAVFEKATTGPLLDTRSNKWDQEHRIYSKAVDETLDGYLSRTNTLPGKMTGDQAREFLATEIFGSLDPQIKNYNTGIQIRENAFKYFRRGGRE